MYMGEIYRLSWFFHFTDLFIITLQILLHELLIHIENTLLLKRLCSIRFYYNPGCVQNWKVNYHLILSHDLVLSLDRTAFEIWVKDSTALSFTLIIHNKDRVETLWKQWTHTQESLDAPPCTGKVCSRKA